MSEESQADLAASSAASSRADDLSGGARPLVRLSLLLPALLLLAAVAGYFFGSRSAAPADIPPPTPDQFSGAAFSPQATADDLLAEGDRVTRQAMAEFPQSPQAMSVRARHAYQLRNTDEAVGLWEQAIAEDPTFADGFFGLGLVAVSHDEYREAARYFEEVAARNPGDRRVPVLLADALMKSGAVEEAIMVLEEHLQGQGTTAEALTTLGQAYLQAQRYESARRSFEAAVTAAPNMRDAVYGLARAHAQLGDKRRANAYMEQFRKLDTAHRSEYSDQVKSSDDEDYAREVAAQALDDAARLYRDRGNFGMAEEFWRKAAALKPLVPDYLMSLSLLYADQKRYIDGLHISRRLVEIAPEEADYWLNLGVMYAHLNRSEEALAALERALLLEPDNTRGRQFYAILEENNEL